MKMPHADFFAHKKRGNAMKSALILAALLLSTAGVEARGGGGHGMSGTGSSSSSHSVSGYTRSNGTYVAPHHSTNPNGTQLDNYGTRGNVNSYTGAVGTHGADH
jgi:hypothetical protein